MSYLKDFTIPNSNSADFKKKLYAYQSCINWKY